jgi:hypothetical protein
MGIVKGIGLDTIAINPGLLDGNTRNVPPFAGSQADRKAIHKTCGCQGMGNLAGAPVLCVSQF